jgi:hypothetical protein
MLNLNKNNFIKHLILIFYMAGKPPKPAIPQPYASSWGKLKGDELKKRVDEVRLIKYNNIVKKYQYEEDSFVTSLEPKYFWIIDFMKKQQFKLEKTMETMGASVVSMFFGEMSARKQHLERRGMEIIGTVNVVVKSIINLLYDLREFDRRLKIYDELIVDDKSKQEAADAALKRVWMDEVDIRKGGASINSMSAQKGLEFITLRDAFMIAKGTKDVDKMDINDRIKRILTGRLVEYEKWRDESDKELHQRRRIELAYLKSQVETLRLYSMWARPYLEAAQRLSFEDVSVKDPDLIQAFDQNVIKITVRGTKFFHLKDLFKRTGLPRGQSPPATWSEERQEEWKLARLGPKVIGIEEVEFTFRSKPALVSQAQTGGAFRQLGKLIIEFRGYAMRLDEYEKLEKQEEWEAMKFIEGMTTESLSTMREEIDTYLSELDKEEKKEEKKKTEPIIDKFMKGIGFGKAGGSIEGLLGGFTSLNQRALEDRAKTVLRDEMVDKIFTLYDIFKKAHGFLSFPYFPTFKAPKPPR